LPVVFTMGGKCTDLRLREWYWNKARATPLGRIEEGGEEPNKRPGDSAVALTCVDDVLVHESTFRSCRANDLI
jgi:hypothetical protein